jgi:hypothetical protein
MGVVGIIYLGKLCLLVRLRSGADLNRRAERLTLNVRTT